MPEPIPRPVLRRLQRIVGEDHVLADPDRLLVYESDGLTAYRCPPQAVVLPASTREVSEVVAVLHGEGLPVIARGAGTGLSGGALAVRGGVIVGTSRMRRILDIDPENRTARVQCGVVNADLGAALAPHGLHYAPDPSSQSTCTLGGNVAENSGGPHCLKYGVTTRYISGLTLVLDGGRTVELGGLGRETTGGLDLVGAFVGSEGCFGMATEVEVRLLPLPQSVRTLLGVFDTVEAAGTAVTSIIGDGLLPAALEIMDGGSIRAVEESSYAAGYPVDAGAVLVIEFDGCEAGLDDEAARAEAWCRKAGAREVRRATSEAERMALWQGRKKAFGVMGRIAPDLLVQDATVPRTRLPEVLHRIEEIGARYDLHVASVFHAGDGNLHPKILFDRRDAEETERVERASKEIMAVCVEAGGTITGEHGVGVDKRDYMPLVTGPEELAVMREVRRAFDPEERFNPGKVLPEEEVGRRDGDVPEGGGAEERAAAAGDGLRSTEDGGGAGSGAARLGERATGFDTEAVRALREQLRALSRGAEQEIAEWGTGRTRQALGEGKSGERRRIRIVGSGTEAVWAESDVLVSTKSLAGIQAYEPADLTITVGGGTPLMEVQAALTERGQFLPFDPPGGGGRTVGGVVASGLGGPLGGGYGRVRDHVLGLTLVTSDGRVLRLGGRVMKNVAGFDLVRPVIGSRGALGVVAAATLRVFPVPPQDRALVFRAEPEELMRLAAAVRTAPVVPASAVLARTSAGAPAYLVVRLHGAPPVVDAQARLLGLGPPTETQVPGGEAGAVVAARDAGLDAAVRMRLTAPPSRLGAALEALEEARPGAPFLADLMEGSLVAGLAEDGGSALRLARAVRKIGGDARLLRGPAVLAAELTEKGAGRELAARVQRAFDPHGLLGEEWM